MNPSVFCSTFDPCFSSLSGCNSDSAGTTRGRCLGCLVAVKVAKLLSCLTVIYNAVGGTIGCTGRGPVLVTYISTIVYCTIRTIMGLCRPVAAPLFFVFVTLYRTFMEGTGTRGSTMSTMWVL